MGSIDIQFLLNSGGVSLAQESLFNSEPIRGAELSMVLSRFGLGHVLWIGGPAKDRLIHEGVFQNFYFKGDHLFVGYKSVERVGTKVKGVSGNCCLVCKNIQASRNLRDGSIHLRDIKNDQQLMLIPCPSREALEEYPEVLLYSAERIHLRLKECISSVDNWAASIFAETKKPVVAAVLLEGGRMFYDEVLQELKTPVAKLYLKGTAYAEADQKASHFSLHFRSSVLEPDGANTDLSSLRGRHVLLIDDIWESGVTFSKTAQTLQDSYKIAQVKTFAMIFRGDSPYEENPIHFQAPDWFLFNHAQVFPDLTLSRCWLEGHGLDDGKRPWGREAKEIIAYRHR